MIALSRLEIRNGWWVEERATVPCALPKDGLIVVFNTADVKDVLDAHYPYINRNGERVWYFNATKDREIAEQNGERVSANPCVLWDHFMKKEG